MSFNVLDISGFKLNHFTQINNSLTNGLNPDFSFYGGVNLLRDKLIFVKYSNCTVEDISFGNNSTTITQYDSTGSGTILDISLGYLITDLSYTRYRNYHLTDMAVDTSNVYACGFARDNTTNLEIGFIYSFDLSGNVNESFTKSGVLGVSGYYFIDNSSNKVGSRLKNLYLKENNIIAGGEWFNNPDASNTTILLTSINYDATINSGWGFPNGSSSIVDIPYNYKISSIGADVSGLPLSNLTSYSNKSSDPVIFFANADSSANFTTTGYTVDSSNGEILYSNDVSNTGLSNLFVRKCVDNWLMNDGSVYVGGDYTPNSGLRSWYVAQLDGSFNFMQENFGGNNGYVNQPDICGSIINYIQLIPGSSSTDINQDTMFFSLGNISQRNNHRHWEDVSVNLFTLLDVSGTFEKETMEKLASYSDYLNTVNNSQFIDSTLADNLSGTKENLDMHLYECASGLNLVEMGAYINSTYPAISSNLLAPRLAPICFQKGTKIQCDQGIIKIENIIPNQHTINGKSINFVTNTIHTEDTLIKFKKDCFAPNRPSEDLICSPEHKLYFKNKLIEAKEFVDKFTNIIRIKNKKEVLYNILMDKHEIIIANNIPVESLHPNNLIAVLNSNYNNKKIKDLCLKNIGNINNYNKNVKKINEPKKVKFEVWKKNKIFD